MKKFSSNKVLLILFSAVLLTSCSKSNKSVSTLTGWEYNNPKYGGFQANSNYREQGPPPGMVLIEGGTFTMGHVRTMCFSTGIPRQTSNKYDHSIWMKQKSGI